MQKIGFAVALPFRGIELARLEGRGIGGVADLLLRLRVAQAPELAEEIQPPPAHLVAQILSQVGKEAEVRRGAKLLALEEQGGLRGEEEKAGHGPGIFRSR